MAHRIDPELRDPPERHPRASRLLSDPEWGWPILQPSVPRKIPFIDITGDNERSAA
jgi:hypothetical protein